jgi:hypothetical protein
LAATTPESVRVQVVLVVAQSSKWPLVGTDIGPTIVFDALMAAAAAIVNVNALDALSKPNEPVVVLATPRVGVAVQDDAVVLVALGIVPAAALVALVPPLPIATVLSAHVPEVVNVPPLRPVPQVTLVTVPLPPDAGGAVAK